MKLKIFSSSFARKSFSNSAKQRIETINTKLPRIRENRTFINRAIYIINEKKKKKKRIISSIIDYRMPPSKLEGETGWIASFRKRERERRGEEKRKRAARLDLSSSRGEIKFSRNRSERRESWPARFFSVGKL